MILASSGRTMQHAGDGEQYKQDSSMNSENNESGTPVYPDHHYLLKLAQAKMPYGKYAGRYLVDLPESYVVWFSRTGFPQGDLGDMLRTVYEIKTNGLEYLFQSLKGP
jgi:uncharacterized protein (DUF3820 family)